jgi:endonuclease G, mitochondrial
MDKLKKASRLKAMLTQIAPGSVETVARPTSPPPAVEGVSPPPALEALRSPDATQSAIDSGLQKLAQNRHEDMHPHEIFALEAIVMPQNRPVVFVRGQSYDNVEHPWEALNGADVKARISALFPSIGRVEVPNSPLVPYAGTGFVVGDGLLMTNRHVAQIFSEGLGLTIRYQAGNAAIDFKRQIDTPGDDHTSYLQVDGVEMIHPYWDMALLRVNGLAGVAPLRLSVKSPEELVDHNIVAIGYPARDPRSDLDLQDRIFARTYNVKRLQPGTIRPRGQIQSFETLVNALTHDASTLGGNSGTGIIDVDTGEVVALHFAGEYLKANYAVPMYELARDRRLASKLNFDKPVPAATTDFDAAWASTESEGTARRTTPATSGGGKASAQSPPSSGSLQPPVGAQSSSAGESGRASWTIPLEISVTIGRSSGPSLQSGVLRLDVAAPQEAEAGVEAGVEAVVVDQDYSDREGYEPDFLEQISVPLPRLSPDMEKDTAEVEADSRKHDDSFELTYYHYSIYMNKRRRTAWFSAANVDGDRRPKIGKRQGDRWYSDPRIDKSAQLGQNAFEHGIDRGHLTRREDTAWGDDVDAATKANNDTFHFTNCSLQASPFNRGKDRWQGLEQFLLEQHAKKERRRMIVMTGPLFGAADPVYQNDRMDYSVRCPLQFWKVCVLIRERDGTPSATGFILGQEDIKDLPGFEAVFDVGATQIKIADLEERTGLDFGDLKNFDHFAAGGAPGSLEMPGMTGAKRVKPIRAPHEIVV